jgi:hypothetical protein
MKSGLLYLVHLGISLGLKILLELLPSQLWLGGVLVVNIDTPCELDLIIVVTNAVMDP